MTVVLYYMLSISILCVLMTVPILCLTCSIFHMFQRHSVMFILLYHVQ